MDVLRAARITWERLNLQIGDAKQGSVAYFGGFAVEVLALPQFFITGLIRDVYRNIESSPLFHRSVSKTFSEEDQAAIDENMARKDKAFEDKNAEDLAALFSEDCVFVNQSGKVFTGRRAFLARHEEVFASRKGNKHLLGSVSVKTEKLRQKLHITGATVTVLESYLYTNHKPDLQLKDYNPSAPTKGTVMYTLTKTGAAGSIGGWQFETMQNTPGLPES